MKTFLKILGSLVAVLAALVVAYGVANHAPDRSVEELKARWAPPPSQFVEIAGMQVHLRDEGLREDPLPIVLLHGTSSSLHTWEGWVQALKAEHRVISYDMPGFGLTGPDPSGDYTIERYAQVVVAVLDKLGVQRCVLAGNSLGGAVAWGTAVLHPERIAKLVLVDAGGYALNYGSLPLGWKLIRNPVLEPLVRDILPRRIVEEGVNKVYGDPSRITPELVDRYFDISTREGNRHALALRLRQMKPGALSDRIPELKMPTLIMWGAKDRLIPLEARDRFHHDIAGSQVVTFDDLGHVPMEEDPARTVAAFKEFLGVRPPSPSP